MRVVFVLDHISSDGLSTECFDARKGEKVESRIPGFCQLEVVPVFLLSAAINTSTADNPNIILFIVSH
jgi:hypothetical protein